MVYFNADFLNFFSELSENNNREWFTANKTRFQNSVEKPFAKFVDALIDRAMELDRRIILTSKDAIFRIYRDTRFSTDKTPYKVHMSALIAPGGRKGMHESGMYLQMNHEDWRIYGGAYEMEKEQLHNVRQAIAADLGGFEALLKDKKFADAFGSIHGEENKRIVPELVDAAAKQPLIFKKQFYYFCKFPAETILEEGLVEKCIETYLAGKPMGDFLASAMRG